jgi:hypothetical protein
MSLWLHVTLKNQLCLNVHSLYCDRCRACRAVGVPEHDLFETVDLFEERDIGCVVRCLFALGRTIQVTVPEFRGPVLGPKLVVPNNGLW